MVSLDFSLGRTRTHLRKFTSPVQILVAHIKMKMYKMQCYIMHASFKLISLAVLEIQHTAAFDSRYLIKEKSVIEPKIIFGLISLELPRYTHLLIHDVL